MGKQSQLILSMMTLLLAGGCTTHSKHAKTTFVYDKKVGRMPASVVAQNGRTVAELVKEGLDQGRPHVPNELLVQFRAGTSDSDKKRVRGLVGGKKKENVVSRSGGEDLELVSVGSNVSLTKHIERLSQDQSVDFAEPNWVFQHSDVSNDTYYSNGSLWGTYGDASTPSNQFGSQAAEAWVTGTNCSDVVIGIIDEGYMYSHPELVANAYKNPGEVDGNGVDDDNNGYIDDVYGWDFASNDKSVFDGAGDDHGTHVAGTIGALGGNAVGTAGICWSVKLMNAKFLGNRGGTLANAIKATDYFTNLKLAGVNIVATNNSWGGGGYSQGLYDALLRAENADIVYVAAAGNDARNNDTTVSYPSGYNLDSIISVAAITNTGAVASFSNYGFTSVDIGAPGAAIWSTVPKSSKGKILAAYASYNGTSMATPHVTGAVALYKARHPDASALETRDAILNSAVPTPSLVNKVSTEGRLSVEGF